MNTREEEEDHRCTSIVTSRRLLELHRYKQKTTQIAKNWQKPIFINGFKRAQKEEKM